MSRLAKKPIIIPQGVTVLNDQLEWTFQGPKGSVRHRFPSIIVLAIQEGAIVISLRKDAGKQKWHRAMLGTAAALVRNAIDGVSNGFEKKLELEGIGYKAQLEGKDLVLALGFTHPVRVSPPSGISFSVEKNTITIAGSNKALVGDIAASIRSQKPPEPYKGKGIHYQGEIIRRKAGKKAVSTA